MEDPGVSSEALRREVAQLQARVSELEEAAARRRSCEEAQKAGEERFRAIVESTTDCILVWDREYNYIYANQAAIDHVGVDRDKVIGRNIRDGLGHVPDFMRLWMSRVDAVFETGRPMSVEDAMQVGDRLVYSESRLSPIRDAEGRMFAVGVVYRDVTDRREVEIELRQAREELERRVEERTADLDRANRALKKEIEERVRIEEDLRESRYLLNRTQEIARIGGWDWDLATNLVSWTDEVFRLVGEPVGSFQPAIADYLGRIHPDDLDAVRDEIGQTIDGRGRNRFHVEYRVFRRDGAIRNALSIGEITCDEHGNPVRMVGTVQDITEQRLLMGALEESEAKFRQFLDYAPIPIAVSDRQDRIEYVNRCFTNVLGYDLEDIERVEDWWRAAYPDPDYREEAKARWEASLAEAAGRGQPSVPSEYTVRCKDGGFKTLQIHGDFIRDKLFVVLLDITGRKEAERALIQRERELRLIFENNRDAILWASADSGVILNCNPAAERLFRRNREEILGMHYLQFHAPEQSNHFRQVFGEAVERGGGMVIPAEVLDAEGHAHPVEIHTSLADLGDRRIVQGILHDVSERNRSQRAIRKSQEKFSKVFQASPDIIGISTVSDGRYLEVNEAFLAGLGYEREEVIGKTSMELGIWQNPEDRPRLIRLMQEQGHVRNEEFLFRRKSGELVVGLVSAEIIEVAGERLLLAVTRDITERKRMESALQEANESLSAIVRSSPLAIIAMHADGAVKLWNPAAEELYGWREDEVLGSPIPTVPEGFQAVHGELLARVLRGEEHVGAEEERLTREGRRLHVVVSRAPLRDAAGRIVGMMSVSTDVTAQKKTEQALKLMQIAVDRASGAFFWIMPDGRFTYVNEAACRSLGYAREELLRLGVRDIGPDWLEEAWPFHWEELKRQGALRFETTHMSRQGRVFPVEILANYVAHGDSEFNFAYVQDITERRQAEDLMRSSLREKEVLLQEIHHRVKNNLQIISSLLELQSDKIRDAEALEMFRESRGRVKSMALIHEKLYQLEDLAKIDFADYVRSLVRSISVAYSKFSQHVEIVVDSPHVPLGVNSAIPCGLILNELVTNALKHAFPSGRSGKVVVTMRWNPNARISLSVRDNGVGIAPGLDLHRAKSLGLEIVRTLARQLRGSLDVRVQEGTEFTLEFDDEPDQALR